MKSHFLGFSIDFIQSELIDFDTFITDLSSKQTCYDLGPSHNPQRRKLYLNTTHNPDFYFGMIITIRDQKKFCQGQASNEDFTFDVIDLKDAHKILEFNYFLINKKSKLGLYQYYHNSCTAKSFGNYLKRLLRAYCTECIDSELMNEITLNNNEDLSSAKKTKIRKKYMANLNFSILIQQEKLEELLAHYKKIKQFEFEYTTLTPTIKKATPLSSHVSKKRERLTFQIPTNVKNLAKDIASFVKSKKPKLGNIKVENDRGDEENLKIFNMPDYFATYEFDDLADKLTNVKASEFYKSDIVGLLLQCHDNKAYDHIFQIEVEDEN